jgi:RNA polymerase sigma-70 factor (ECF subfamily)
LSQPTRGQRHARFLANTVDWSQGHAAQGSSASFWNDFSGVGGGIALATTLAHRRRPCMPAASLTRNLTLARELRTALVELVPELRVRALRLCGDRALADDVVQDALERALRFEAQYERGTNLRAWLFRILFSVFVTRWRRRRRERRALENLAVDPCAWTTPSGFAAPDIGEGALSASTRRKLDALPEGFRAAVVMVDLEQRSYREAARALGIPVGTVMSRLHRARKVLAALIDSERQAA